jgi:hypothetical protein
MIPVLTVVLCIAKIALANEPPVADAGLSRYTGTDPVQLDGRGSYDPDQSGSLRYAWTQVSGPSLVIADANAARPTISGFTQTDEIQECEFELTISDGEWTSLPDVVKVIIVPDFGARTFQQENPPFDRDKPTVITFSGGDCITGSGRVWNSSAWNNKANVIGFPDGYWPDSDARPPTYHRFGDVIIVYLSSVAPDYTQPIQSIGHSTGGMPAIDVGTHLNRVYGDARYAVNRVTQLDAGCRWNQSTDFAWRSYELFLTSAVDEEQCWIDEYYGAFYSGEPYAYFTWPDELVVTLGVLDHQSVRSWYWNSLTAENMNKFNSGVVAGAYWSVIGPGKNLQLAPTDAYYFRWDGRIASGGMSIFDEARHPGRLPEPVTLGAWITLDDTSGEVDGAILTCHESENAIGYELLFGSDPYRIMDFRVISDTPLPPMDAVRDLPSEETWWTVRVRDAFGSTIYADPVRLNLTNLPVLSVTNARTGKRYGLISHAILGAESGDVILLDPGIYEENIEFGGTPLTVSSLDPNDPVVVSGTIIRGRDGEPTVRFSGPESTGCTLVGLTIQSATVGVSCRDAAPTIRSCVLEGSGGIAIEYWHGQTPRLIDCTILGQTKEGGDPGLVAYWQFDEAEGSIAYDSEGDRDATVTGVPLWQPEGGMIGGALQFDGLTNFVLTSVVQDPSEGSLSVFAWVKGGAPGQVILSQWGGANWLMAASDGCLKTELKNSGRFDGPLTTEVVITDGTWHRVGFVWDGSNRILYVDDVLVADDVQDAMPACTGNLIIGSDKDKTAGTFWEGLIDDVRIYNRPVKP